MSHNPPLPRNGVQSRRWAAIVEYCGTGFAGWQVQPTQSVRTVQAAVEQMLSSVSGHPIRVRCAGRTDKGVHAIHQAIHFDSDVDRSPANWLHGGNAKGPKDVSLRWVGEVESSFDARRSCFSRTYEYLIINAPVRSALCSGRISQWTYPLDIQAMQQAASLFVGKRDFSAVRAAGCQAQSAVRHVTEAVVSRYGRIISVRVSANAFLLHMVRNIVGILLQVGSGRQTIVWAEQVIQSGVRALAAPTASPDGLYLVNLQYPQHFGLPSGADGVVPFFANADGATGQ